MQWDHLPEFEKLGDLSNGFPGRGEEEILSEIAKCELVCTNCHSVRTFQRNGWDRRPLPEVERPVRTGMRTDVNSGASEDAVLRRCAMCERSKPASEFHRSRTGQFSYCRDCRCSYDRRYYAERGKPARLERKRVRRGAARSWVDTLKEGRPCADCGGEFRSYVMHWDHLPGYLKVSEISTMVGAWSREAIIDELKKCELVCANCHVMRTVVRARRTLAEDAGDYRPWVTVAA